MTVQIQKDTLSNTYMAIDIEWDMTCPAYNTATGGAQNLTETAGYAVRYVRSHSPMTLTIGASNVVYTALPEMDFEMLETTKGGTTDDPYRITVPISTFPANVMIGNPFPTARITVWQISIGEAGLKAVSPILADYQRIMIARGYVGRTIARHNSKPNTVAMECYRAKSQCANVTVGLISTQRCSWAFTDLACGYSLANASSTATITAISGASVTFSLTAVGSGLTGAHMAQPFTSGYILFQGLKILVRQHSAEGSYANGGTHTVLLAYAPPLHPNYTWLNKSVTVVAGCRKNKTSCIAWGNAQHFGGFGVLVPTYNAVWEVGGGAPA